MASIYHGLHDYSTFSASTIPPQKTDYVDEEATKCWKCCCCLCRFSSRLILHPVGPFRCLWDMFVMLLLVYTSIEIPYTMAFGLTSTIQYIGLFVDAFLLIDIVFNFHTAYFDKYDNLRLVTTKKYICKKYFRTWFIVDFLTCIPFEFVLNDPNGALNYLKVLRVFRLFRIIKILRFVKMLRIFDAFMKQFIVREVLVFMKLFKIIFSMLMFAHFAACLWWFVGSTTAEYSWIDAASDAEKGIHLRDNQSTTPFQQYSYAWYWAVVTLFTTGYGDIVATNTVEQWVCSISILVGTCFFAYFVGTLTVLITEGDKIKAYESEKLEEAQSFCEKKKLPKELTRAVLTHIRYHCTYNFIFDEGELLSILPAYLQHDIHTYVSKQFLLDLNIFQNRYIHLPEFIIGLIAVKTKSISCNEMYKLYDIGDMAKEFYIQRTGKAIMYDKRNKPLQQLSRGSVCGEYSSILFKKRRLKVQCQTWSEFYSISIDDIKDILNQYYPKTAHTKWRQIKKYAKHSYKDHIRHCVELNGYGMHYLQTSPSLHSVPTLLHSVNKSNSIRANKVYEEENGRIHLFNNTRDASKSIRDAEKDLEPTTQLTQPGTVAPANGDKSMSDIVIVTTSDIGGGDHTPSTSNNIKKSKTASHKLAPPKRSRSGTFAKFKLRSNSEIRNQIIVNHTEKHNKSAYPNPKKKSSFRNLTSRILPSKRSPTLSKSQTELKVKNIPNIPNNWHKSSNEMTTVGTCATYRTTEDIDTRRSMSIRSAYSAISRYDDSECSLSSIDTESSGCEHGTPSPIGMHPTLQNNKSRGSNTHILEPKKSKSCHKTTVTKTKRRKRRRRGKFGGAGVFGGNRRAVTSTRKLKVVYKPTSKVMSSDCTEEIVTNSDTDHEEEDREVIESITVTAHRKDKDTSPDSFDLLAPLGRRAPVNINNTKNEKGGDPQEKDGAKREPVINTYIEYKQVNQNECNT